MNEDLQALQEQDFTRIRKVGTIGSSLRQIYLLLNSGNVVYIGKTKDLLGRISAHQGDKEFDEVMSFWIPVEEVGVFEKALIAYFKPPGNQKHVNKNITQLYQHILSERLGISVE